MHGAERPQREDEIRVRARAEERRSHREESRARVDLVRPQVERRADEDVPEPVDRDIRGAEPAQHVAERPVGLRVAQPREHERQAQAIAERQVPVEQEARRRDRRDGAVLRDDRQREPLPQHGSAFAHPVEEAQVLREAAERDVLAVVRRRLGIAVARGQRLHRSAERRPRFVERHVDVRVHEIERSREAREPAADDCHLHRTSPRATTASFAGVDKRHDGPNTSKPLASMRSSWPR